MQISLFYQEKLKRQNTNEVLYIQKNLSLNLKSKPMNMTLINILETSPTYFFEQEITLDNSLTLRYIILTFDLILLSTLNHAKLKQFTLFTFYIDKFFSQVKLKVSNDFDFVKMKYDSNINLVYPEELVNQSSAQIDNYNHKENKYQRITLKYSLNDLQQPKSATKSKIKFNFGAINGSNEDSNSFGRFSIQNLNYEVQGNNNLRKQQIQALAKYPLIQSSSLCNHEDQQGSFPLIYMNEQNNLKQEGEEYFSELISNLQPYSTPNTSSKPNHLFICHDMKDGYYEDTRFTNPVEKKRTNSFRFNYLWQTSILNYFSHKTISIPPRHWRQLCKRYEVKCLGTFIVEAQRVNQTYYLSNQFALKLVYLAKKYKFDGYLINIENQIRDIQKLENWLAFLTNKIHTQIPGSAISWYDSVITNGNVEYQNQINQKNKIFYDLTDSFYTNYWWSDQKLKTDLTQAQPNKTIYVGNDVWGRGTFGGGQFYLYKAIDQIQKLNKPNQPNLVPALFAPGYTYQNGGQNNNPYLKANEDRLYRGVIFDKVELKQWKAIDEKNLNILKLKNQNKWFTKVYSMNLWLYKNKGKIKITFTYRFNETLSQPDTFLDYKILMRLQDTLLNQTLQNAEILRQKVQLTQRSVKKVELVVDTEKLTSKTDIQIYQAALIQNVILTNQILISYYLPDIDWIQEVPITKLSFNQPYNSYLNIGHGDSFYFKGNPILKSYNYMADYDLPPTLSINHPFFTSIEHQDAYIGGSSLIIQSPSIKLFPINLPSTQFNYPHSYFLKIVIKACTVDSLYLSQTNGFSVFFTKVSQTQLQSQWVQQLYEITLQNMKKMKKKFFKDLQTSLMMSLKSKCLLGQILLMPQSINPAPKQNQKLQVSISQSFRSLNNDQIFINLQFTEMLFGGDENLLQTNRYLVIIDELLSSFVYMSKQKSMHKGRLGQISLKIKQSKSKIEVYNLDRGINQELILSQSNINLFELKKSPLSHKIQIRNY